MGNKEYEQARQDGLDAAGRFFYPNDLGDLVFGLGDLVCSGLREIANEPVGQTYRRMVECFREIRKEEGLLQAAGYVPLDLAFTVFVQASGLALKTVDAASEIRDFFIDGYYLLRYR